SAEEHYGLRHECPRARAIVTEHTILALAICLMCRDLTALDAQAIDTRLRRPSHVLARRLSAMDGAVQMTVPRSYWRAARIWPPTPGLPILLYAKRRAR